MRFPKGTKYRNISACLYNFTFFPMNKISIEHTNFENRGNRILVKLVDAVLYLPLLLGGGVKKNWNGNVPCKFLLLKKKCFE